MAIIVVGEVTVEEDSVEEAVGGDLATEAMDAEDKVVEAEVVVVALE